MHDRFLAGKQLHRDATGTEAPWGFVLGLIALEEAIPLVRALTTHFSPPARPTIPVANPARGWRYQLNMDVPGPPIFSTPEE